MFNGWTELLFFAGKTYKRVCYYTNWSQYRNGNAKFFPEDVDPSLCSHVVYAFATMSGNKLAKYEWNDEAMLVRYHQYSFSGTVCRYTLPCIEGSNMSTKRQVKSTNTYCDRHNTLLIITIIQNTIV